jgi:hypothetical protein
METNRLLPILEKIAFRKGHADEILEFLKKVAPDDATRMMSELTGGRSTLRKAKDWFLGVNPADVALGKLKHEMTGLRGLADVQKAKETVKTLKSQHASDIAKMQKKMQQKIDRAIELKNKYYDKYQGEILGDNLKRNIGVGVGGLAIGGAGTAYGLSKYHQNRLNKEKQMAAAQGLGIGMALPRMESLNQMAYPQGYGNYNY